MGSWHVIGFFAEPGANGKSLVFPHLSDLSETNYLGPVNCPRSNAQVTGIIDLENQVYIIAGSGIFRRGNTPVVVIPAPG